jgi:hypothetical protein
MREKQGFMDVQQKYSCPSLVAATILSQKFAAQYVHETVTNAAK